MTLFVRLGSDYTQHYYEYSLPLTLTPAGRYSSLSPSDRRRAIGLRRIASTSA